MQTNLDPVKAVAEEAGRFDWGPHASGDAFLTFRRAGQTLHANADKHWLSLSVTFDDPPPPGLPTWQSLLSSTRSCFLAKYAIDGVRPCLLCELPRDGLGANDCARAVEAVSVYGARASVGMSQLSPTRIAEAEVGLFGRQEMIRLFSAIENTGWKLWDQLGLNHWHAIYQGQERRFNVFVSFTSSWVYFQIPILDGLSSHRRQGVTFREILYRHLLHYNQRMHWTKFGLDHNEEIVLVLDFPMETFGLKRFRQATEGLAESTAEYASEVKILVELNHDPDLAAKLALGAEL